MDLAIVIQQQVNLEGKGTYIILLAHPTHLVEYRLTRTSRTIEFVTLYFFLPIFFAVVLPPTAIWFALPIIAVLAVVLLARTPEFNWKTLSRSGRGHLPFVLVFLVAMVIVVFMVPLILHQELSIRLPRNQPWNWGIELLIYPLVSVIPQEFAYRVLFYERYGTLFENRFIALAVNGLCFSLAHLFLWNGCAILLSGLGSIAFAIAYRWRGSFGLACVLHMIAGQLLFATGIGVFFYHGAVS